MTWKICNFVHIWNNYRALSKKRSVIDGTYVDDRFILKKISLDEDVLDKIPLNERLVFRLNEDPKYLYHEFVISALSSAGLTGFRFVRVSDWGPHSAFNIEAG
ncbi:hypothetical protein L4174_009105 [Photobacterium sp. CCB-ST2H9]|nr:hypothetical protein [Photobacterium sp. CCB-ST2H9]UTM56012.1 hypothetical protein L4174_009105 [Photobacterium sp. CCB-ST2H9]